MSEFAQQQLEKLIPIFEVLQRTELIKPPQIKKVISKCQGYEYKLQKKQKTKTDFLQYAKYLTHFLALIRQRRELIGWWFKKEEIDYAIAQKIDSLYRTACMRNQGDVKLWLTRIEFAKHRTANRSISKLYSRMLKVHSGKPRLWIEAAKFELEENHSVENGRHVLHRALRTHSKCQKLWIELFRLELMNVDILRKRRDVLVPSETEEMSPAAVDEADPLLQGKLAQLVFKEAMDSVGLIDTVKFCLSFITVTSEFPFATQLELYIFQFAKENFPQSEEMWKFCAERHSADEKGEAVEDSCKQIFEEAVSKVDTTKMWAYYTDYCAEQYRLLSESASKQLVSKAKADLLDVLDRFSRRHLPPESYFMLKAEIVGDNFEETSVVYGCALTAYPCSLAARKGILCSAIQTGQSAKDIQTLFNNAINSVEVTETYPIWEVMLAWCASKQPDKLEKLIDTGIKDCTAVSSRLKELYLNYLMESEDCGLVNLRSQFKRLAAMKPTSLTFYRRYIRFETENYRDSSSAKAIRSAYDWAVVEHGHDSAEIWDEFYAFEESSIGSAENAAKIYKRAVSTLTPAMSEQFIQLQTLRKAAGL